MKLRAVLEVHGKTATGVTVPPVIVEALGVGKRPAGRVMVSPDTWRSTVAPTRQRRIDAPTAGPQAAKLDR